VDALTAGMASDHAISRRGAGRRCPRCDGLTRRGLGRIRVKIERAAGRMLNLANQRRVRPDSRDDEGGRNLPRLRAAQRQAVGGHEQRAEQHGQDDHDKPRAIKEAGGRRPPAAVTLVRVPLDAAVPPAANAASSGSTIGCVRSAARRPADVALKDRRKLEPAR